MCSSGRCLDLAPSVLPLASAVLECEVAGVVTWLSLLPFLAVLAAALPGAARGLGLDWCCVSRLWCLRPRGTFLKWRYSCSSERSPSRLQWRGPNLRSVRDPSPGGASQQAGVSGIRPPVEPPSRQERPGSVPRRSLPAGLKLSEPLLVTIRPPSRLEASGVPSPSHAPFPRWLPCRGTWLFPPVSGRGGPPAAFRLGLGLTPRPVPLPVGHFPYANHFL